MKCVQTWPCVPVALLPALCWAVLGCGGPGGATPNAPLPGDTQDAGPVLRGVPGEPCEASTPCDGVCVDTDDGSVCAGACAGAGCADVCLDTCPIGFSCVPSPDVNGEPGVLCAPNDAVLCRPCMDDSDCQALVSATCVDYGSEGRYCGAKCDADPACPLGFLCDESGNCVATEGNCPCRPGAVGYATECRVGATVDACVGTRECTPEGLSDCVVASPKTEVCNGQDDDCDGSTDEEGVCEEPVKAPQACYPGPQNTWDVCFDLVPINSIASSDYDYLAAPPSAQPGWLQGNYAPPTHVLDLSTVDPETLLALNFKVKELMQSAKGAYGIFQPHAVAAIQTVRASLASPLHVTSGYRCPGYNAGIDGAATYSRHQYGDAVDVYSNDHDLETIIESCCSHGAWFVKLYETHVHCDWRADPLDDGFWHSVSGPPPAPLKPSGSVSCASFGFPQSF